MPGRFLTEEERDRISHFPFGITEEDIIKYFTLSPSDLTFIPTHSSDYNRLGFALQLCTLRYIGFVPNSILSIPFPVIEFVATQLKIKPETLKQYGKRIKTINEHFNNIKDYLNFQRLDSDYTDRLINWLLERTMEHDKPSFLLHLINEKLFQDKIVRPGITTLEEIISLARNKANRKTFELLSPILTGKVKAFLDKILVVDSITGKSDFAWLKTKATSNTPENLIETVKKLEYLEKHEVNNWTLTMLNPNRIKFLAQVGKKSTNQAFQRIKEIRRYPILVCFLYQSYIEIIDELVDLFDGCLTKACEGAKRDLDKFKKKNAKTVNQKMKLFKIIGETVLDEQIFDTQLRDEIYKKIPKEKLMAAIMDCNGLIRPDDDNYFDFLNNRYSYIRQFAPAFMKSIKFQSNQVDESIIEGVELINTLNEQNKRKIPEDSPIDFVSAKWRPYVIDKEGKIDRHYYELSLLSELQGSIKAGNVYIDNSLNYANPDTYLTPMDKWKELETEVCKQINLPEDGRIRLNERIKESEERLDRVNKMLNHNGKVRIEKDELIISPLEAQEESESFKELTKLIEERLPRIELANLLIEVDSWINYTQHFEHASGLEKPPKDFLKHLYAAIIGQGNNLGLTRMAQIASMSYNKLSWLSNWYIREDTLKKAFDSIVNFHYHLPLSRFWGNGDLSSSDAQAVQVSGKIINAGWKSRLFGPNKLIEFYSWTCDQYSQYGSKVKPSKIRDATYVLDGILNNETELQISEHTTDTAGYTYLVFALFDLLGLKFSPRIRDLKDQSLFKVNDKVYKNLDSRIKGKIDIDLILNHWDEFKRVAGSLKLGWVTASLYISKLQSYPRQNIITRVLQEYGKLIRTNFILHYLEDEDYRRKIQTQLNKGEAVNGLKQFLSLANERIIRKKQLEEQTNQASCLTLMANAVMTWNTVYMSAIIDQLINEGYSIKEEDIAHLSPARFEHINPYGKLSFDVEKELNRVGLRPFRKP